MFGHKLTRSDEENVWRNCTEYVKISHVMTEDPYGPAVRDAGVHECIFGGGIPGGGVFLRDFKEPGEGPHSGTSLYQ